jgi:hypothetical protein
MEQWRDEKMLSKRRAVHLGLLSAATVFVACLGILFSQADDQTNKPVAPSSAVVQPGQGDSNPGGISLSASTSAHIESDQH